MRRFALVLILAAGSALAARAPLAAQSTGRLNPVIAAQEKGWPIFGIAHPQIVPRGQGRGRAGDPAVPATPPPPPPIVLADVAKETVAYTRADYLFTSGTSETFLRYLEEIKKAGGSVRTHPFSAKIGIWHANPAGVNDAIIRQLNAGHVSVSMEAVESAQEVRDVIKAMRFASVGGTRPDTGLENAANYWNLSVDDYKKKADIWPLNKSGELMVTVIVESLVGLEKVREIAAEPGVAQMFAGYGTLGGVFRGDAPGREAAAMKILAACKEFKIPCGFPVNNPVEMEQRQKEGWSVFIMQRRDDAAFAAVETGRKFGGRYQRVLVRGGMDVHTAENGFRALDVIRRERPAVVVTDIDMPEMDGLELCRTIRADPGLSAIPIVVVSGGGHGPVVEAGCHAVLQKPCAPDVLLETVLRAVGAVRPGRSDN